MVFHNDAGGQMAQQVLLEVGHVHLCVGGHEVLEQGASLSEMLLVLVHIVKQLAEFILTKLVNLLLEDLGITVDLGAITTEGSS